MTDQCAYTNDGQFAVRQLEAEVLNLRTDLNDLLVETAALYQELHDLKKFYKVLRSRVDHNELAPV